MMAAEWKEHRRAVKYVHALSAGSMSRAVSRCPTPPARAEHARGPDKGCRAHQSVGRPQRSVECVCEAQRAVQRVRAPGPEHAGQRAEG